MPKILTVDDSRAVRMIVSKQVREFGFEVDEAEDGEQGLAKAGAAEYDLIVLDVTMPVLDGPGMLEKLRASGNQTPVLMLTSESKRSIVATLMKMGISDYILKPFKPEELQAKIMKALKITDGEITPPAVGADIVQAAPAQAALAVSRSAASPGAGKQFVDILVVDDMENVQKRLRAMLPEHLSLNGVLSAQSALATCRERVFRVALIDYDLPDVNASSLVKQLRLLQPHAVFLAMSLRSVNDVREEVRASGFDGLLYKPFDEEGLEEFLLRHFESQDVVAKEDNVLRVLPFKGREARLPGYFMRLGTVCNDIVGDVAAACFAEVILDLGAVPPVAEKLARMLVSLLETCRRMGVELRLVGPPALGRLLKQIEDTATLVIFPTVADALNGKAA